MRNDRKKASKLGTCLGTHVPDSLAVACVLRTKINAKVLSYAMQLLQHLFHAYFAQPRLLGVTNFRAAPTRRPAGFDEHTLFP